MMLINKHTDSNINFLTYFLRFFLLGTLILILVLKVVEKVDVKLHLNFITQYRYNF